MCLNIYLRNSQTVVQNVGADDTGQNTGKNLQRPVPCPFSQRRATGSQFVQTCRKLADASSQIHCVKNHNKRQGAGNRKSRRVEAFTQRDERGWRRDGTGMRARHPAQPDLLPSQLTRSYGVDEKFEAAGHEPARYRRDNIRGLHLTASYKKNNHLSRMFPNYNATVSALVYSILRERCPGSPNPVVRFVLAEQAHMPGHLRLPVKLLTLAFDATGFHRWPHERRWRRILAWENSRWNACRNLIRLNARLAIFARYDDAR